MVEARKLITINQPNFFPYLGYFHMISKSDIFVFYNHVQYDKNSWRNRNRFLINNKFSWITVPIVHETIKKKISDTKLFRYKNFYEKFFKTLHQFYIKKKNYKKIIKWLELNLPTEVNYLGDLNINMTKKILKYLGIKTETYQSSNMDNIKGKNENLIKIIKSFNCSEYLTGPLGKEYLDLKKFNKNNLRVKVYNLDNKLLNKFSDEKYLSILHLMFCYELENMFKINSSF